MEGWLCVECDLKHSHLGDRHDPYILLVKDGVDQECGEVADHWVLDSGDLGLGEVDITPGGDQLPSHAYLNGVLISHLDDTCMVKSKHIAELGQRIFMKFTSKGEASRRVHPLLIEVVLEGDKKL